jgi:hypothetical protein
MSIRNLPGGVKSGWHIRLTISPLSVSRFSRKCVSLDVSKLYGPAWTVTGITLPFFTTQKTRYVYDQIAKTNW